MIMRHEVETFLLGVALLYCQSAVTWITMLAQSKLSEGYKYLYLDSENVNLIAVG